MHGPQCVILDSSRDYTLLEVAQSHCRSLRFCSKEEIAAVADVIRKKLLLFGIVGNSLFVVVECADHKSLGIRPRPMTTVKASNWIEFRGNASDLLLLTVFVSVVKSLFRLSICLSVCVRHASAVTKQRTSCKIYWHHGNGSGSP